MNIVRVYVGTLMTSLEMAGVSVTLLQTTPQWVEFLGEDSIIILCDYIEIIIIYLADLAQVPTFFL